MEIYKNIILESIIISIIFISGCIDNTTSTDNNDNLKQYTVSFEDNETSFKFLLSGSEYFNGGTSIDYDCEVSDYNTYFISVQITYRKMNPLGEITVDVKPPSEEVVYEMPRDSTSTTTGPVYTLSFFNIYIETPSDEYIDKGLTPKGEINISAANSEEALKIADKNYGYSKARGIWEVDISFGDNALVYDVKEIHFGSSSYMFNITETESEQM